MAPTSPPPPKSPPHSADEDAPSFSRRETETRKGRSTLEAYADALMGRIEAYRDAPDQPLPSPGAVKAAAYGIMALCAQSADLASLAAEVGGAVQSYRLRLEQLAAAKAGPPTKAWESSST